jgi:hypothetical protein
VARDPPPAWPVSSPSELCGDPSLEAGDFCLPAARVERWLRGGGYTVTHAAITQSGSSAPYKLRLVVRIRGRELSFSAKFKPVPEALDEFNESPRLELAAYDLQKLVLDHDEYVVPPTVLACLPLDRYEELLEDLEPFRDTDCALGVLAYWLENVSDDGVYDSDRLERDPLYRRHLSNLNAVTILMGHQDDLGSNFLLADDPDRPRVFAIDNGLAFGAMGANPIQLVSSAWSSLRVETMPARTVARLQALGRKELEPLAVVAQLEHRDEALRAVPHSAPFDRSEGVRERGDVIQLGLTADEITDVHERLVDLLDAIESGDVTVVD